MDLIAAGSADLVNDSTKSQDIWAMIGKVGAVIGTVIAIVTGSIVIYDRMTRDASVQVQAHSMRYEQAPVIDKTEKPPPAETNPPPGMYSFSGLSGYAPRYSGYLVFD